MSESTVRWIAALVGFGLPLGWLLGLSAASVAATLLTSALSALAGASVAVGGIRGIMAARMRALDSHPLDAVREVANVVTAPFTTGFDAALKPEALSGLIMGVALGATMVQCAQDHRSIGSDHPASAASEWRSAIKADGVDSVARRLFQQQHLTDDRSPRPPARADTAPKLPQTNINTTKP